MHFSIFQTKVLIAFFHSFLVLILCLVFQFLNHLVYSPSSSLYLHFNLNLDINLFYFPSSLLLQVTQVTQVIQKSHANVVARKFFVGL